MEGYQRNNEGTVISINDQTCFSFLSAPKNFYRKSVPIFHCVVLFFVAPSSVECLIVDVQVSNPCQKNDARRVLFT